MPLVANLRCGKWYVSPSIRAGLSHFKSGDGHYGQWSFSVRRTNLHMLRVLQEHRGAVVVDATRKGKRFPDALSKTLPIWVCVLNRVLYGNEEESIVLPPWVPENELNSIEKLLPEWTTRFREAVQTSSLEYPARKLGVIWIHRDSTILESYEHLPFTPIFAVSASRTLEDGERADGGGYFYVPGAGDDEETWTMGLDADLFHKNREYILGGGAEACEKRIRQMVQAQASTIHSSCDDRELATVTLWDTGVAFGYSRTLRDVSVWSEYEQILCLGEVSVNPLEHYSEKLVPVHFLNKRGKQDLRHGFQRELPRILDYLRGPKASLIISSDGTDLAIGAAIAFLVGCCEQTGNGHYVRSSTAIEVNKETVNRALIAISKETPATPSRTILKQIHGHFMNRGPRIPQRSDTSVVE